MVLRAKVSRTRMYDVPLLFFVFRNKGLGSCLTVFVEAEMVTTHYLSWLVKLLLSKCVGGNIFRH